MCDQATQTILDGIVKKYVEDRLMFTSLNVSREAQKNHGVTLRHNDMKNEVHRNYANGQMRYNDNGVQSEYERQTITLTGINGQPYVYYPEGVDPNNYDLDALLNGPIDTKDAKAQSGNTVPVPPLSTGSAGSFDPFATASSGMATAVAAAPVKPSVAGKYAVDKRKRLWIPRDLVKAAGGTTRGAWLDVAIDNKTLVITQKGANTATPHTSYKVDSKGNIAVSRNVFEAAGLTASSYDIINLNGKVVVKTA